MGIRDVWGDRGNSRILHYKLHKHDDIDDDDDGEEKEIKWIIFIFIIWFRWGSAKQLCTMVLLLCIERILRVDGIFPKIVKSIWSVPFNVDGIDENDDTANHGVFNWKEQKTMNREKLETSRERRRGRASKQASDTNDTISNAICNDTAATMHRNDRKWNASKN